MPHPRLAPQPGDALLAVDVQLDFLPGGALGVPDGDRVIAPLNRAIGLFAARGLPVITSRDWHPPGHVSFTERGGPWPPHCMQGSPGAAFSPGLQLPPGAMVISKATTVDAEAYSAFEGTPLAEVLRERDVRRIFIGGLATEYCVLETVLDARLLGYEAVVLVDAVQAIDTRPGDGERALARMAARGAVLARTADIGA